MSWKLAELRWRQEAGLQENVGIIGKQQEKSPEIWATRYRDSIRMIETTNFTPKAVWSQPSWDHVRNVRDDHNQTSATSPFLTAQIVPDLDLSDATSPHVSVSSTTPLLKLPRGRSTISFSYVGWSQLDGQEPKLPVFPHREEPCTHMTMSKCRRDHTAWTRRSQIPESKMRLISGSPTTSSLCARTSRKHVLSSERHFQERKCYNFNQVATDDRNAVTDQHPPSAAHSDPPCERFEDNVDRGGKQEPPTPSTCGAMPTLEDLSIESGHSANSDILDNLSSRNHRITTASQRRATRPLYRDLPSAHAEILGYSHRPNFEESPSEFDLRFPLGCSVSSEEEDERENSADPSLPDTSIFLRDLPRGEVLSAHGVLHEAKYHQESSAVFETSDISEEPVLSRRQSATLDEIVSQYADQGLPRSSPYHKKAYHEALREIEDRESNPVHGSPRSAISENRDLDGGLKRRNAQSNITEDLPDEWDARHIRAGSLRSTPIISRNRGAESDGSDGRSQDTPHSSRCGFLTPSKMRFRLTRRNSAEAQFVDRATGSKPASPWDPFARPSPKSRREHLHKLRLSHRIQGGPAILRWPSPSVGLQRRHPPSRPSQDQSQTMQDYSSRLNQPRSLDVNLSHLIQAAVSIPPQGNIYSDSFLLETPTSALPSSSLLPSLTELSRKLPKLSENGIGHPVEDESHASGRDLSVHFQPSPFEPQQEETSTSGLQTLGGTARGRTAGGITTSTNEDHRRRKSPRNDVSTCREDPALLNHQTSPGTALQHLWQSQCDNSDAAISRFLRDSRHGGNATLMRDYRLPFRRGEGGLGINATGSSLADYSSSSTPFGRNRSSNNEFCGESLDRWNSAVYGDGDRQRLGFVVPAASGATGNSGSYRAFNRVESGEATLIPSNSTSASLLPRHETQTHGIKPLTNTRLPLTNQCPTFPLTAEQLATRSDGNRAVPFERLQMLSNGEWLERGWCLVHRRNEFSHASLTTKKAQDGTGVGLERQRQRLAGRLLLALGFATYFVGGFALIHDMARQGPLSQLAIAQFVQRLSRQPESDAAAGGGLLPVYLNLREAEMAQAVERACLVGAVLVLMACFGVCVWAATTF